MITTKRNPKSEENMGSIIETNTPSAQLPLGYEDKHCNNCNCTDSDKKIYQNLFDLAYNEIEPFNWSRWSTLTLFRKDDSIIEQLPREDLLKLVIAHLRGDRFCSGVIDGAIDSGVMMRIANRVQKLS